MTTNLTRNSGLTLIELLITVAIVGVLIASATPSMTEFIQNNRAVTQVNELHTSLSLARNEAIKRNSNITVCRSSNGTTCSGAWQNGWIVFVDNNFVEGNSTPLISTVEQGNTFQKRTLNNGESFTVVKNYPKDSEIRKVINPFGKNIKIIKLDYFWILTFKKK